MDATHSIRPNVQSMQRIQNKRTRVARATPKSKSNIRGNRRRARKGSVREAKSRTRHRRGCRHDELRLVCHFSEFSIYCSICEKEWRKLLDAPTKGNYDLAIGRGYLHRRRNKEDSAKLPV